MQSIHRFSQRYSHHSAFTMIELIFVIVIIGILSAVAIPKFGAISTESQISKGRADISSIRSGIMTERQARLITGDNTYIAGTAINNAKGLFGGILTYPIADKVAAGHWTSTGIDTANKASYNYQVASTTVAFDYNRSSGIFGCDKTTTYCSDLTD